MIKNKVIELNDGINYYVLEEVSHDNKKYILTVECDLENENLNADEFLVMEIKISGTDLITSPIEDDELSKLITKMLLDKIKNNN